MLLDEEVLVLDAQATGASPQHGALLELGWGWTRARDESMRVRTHLLAQDDPGALPKIITRVTGIEPAHLEGAQDIDDVWSSLQSECERHAPARAVIHCARFELSFLQPRVEPGALPFDALCTLEIARRLLPELPRRGLRALSGYFGHGVDQLRRCEDHVLATAFVWRHLVEALAARGIDDWKGARAFAEEQAPARAAKKTFPIPKEVRLRLPDAPGIYRMLRKNGDVLYVGKATSLKRRVNSYFQKQARRNERMLELLSQVRDLDVVQTATPLEAALLETDTIKALEPPYNMALLEESREPCFVSRDLQDVEVVCSDAHPLGPLPSGWRHRRFVGLRALLDGERDTSVVHQAFGWEPQTLPQEVLDEGLALFNERNPKATHDRFRFAAAGLRRWDSQARKDEAFQSDEGAETLWDPQRVLRRLEDTLVFFSLELRRASWLRRLANAAIDYDDGAARRLLVRGGRVRAREPQGALPHVTVIETDFTIATYDRLRILTTELRRVCKQQGAVSLRLGNGRSLDGAAVARMLAWV